MREIIKITKVAPTALHDITARIAIPELSMPKQLKERRGRCLAGRRELNSSAFNDGGNPSEAQWIFCQKVTRDAASTDSTVSNPVLQPSGPIKRPF